MLPGQLVNSRDVMMAIFFQYIEYFKSDFYVTSIAEQKRPFRNIQVSRFRAWLHLKIV